VYLSIAGNVFYQEGIKAFERRLDGIGKVAGEVFNDEYSAIRRVSVSNISRYTEGIGRSITFRSIWIDEVKDAVLIRKRGAIQFSPWPTRRSWINLFYEY
jgi:hypothetical protein